MARPPGGAELQALLRRVGAAPPLTPVVAPRVREICARHGLPYATGSLASQFASAMRRLVRFAVPQHCGA